MSPNYQLGALDYTIVAFSLAISAAIGIIFRFTGGRQKTTQEYLMAGKNMPKFPVVLSVVVTSMSAIAMLGSPGEVYRYGAQYALLAFSVAIGMILSAYVILPVYFQCGVSSIYEFLEMRFGKSTKYTVSALFIIQMVMYMAVALYAPALALSGVTSISVETSIIVLAVICTFYCFIGGLKAVLWTDVFQAGLMFACLVAMYVTAVLEVGGFSEIYHRAVKGQRLDLFDFSADFTTRHTFWNILFQGLIIGAGSYSTNQLVVQRLLSLSSIERAQSAFLWSILPLLVLVLSCSSFGVVLYAVFYTCDPVLDKEETGLTKYDQLVPYFIVTRLSSIPCMTGLCVAGIFSGSLSTISSAINSLSTVTVTDFIQPLFSSVRFNEMRLVFIAKGLAVFYGVACVFLAFVISQADSIVHVTTVTLGLTEGPICAIFLIGILTTKLSEKNILFGLFMGTLFPAWIGFGTMFSDYNNPTLPLNSSLCQSAYNISITNDTSTSNCRHWQNCTIETEEENTSNETFILYKVSFMWISTIGCFVTLFFALIGSLITDRHRSGNGVNLKCLSPVAKLWVSEISSSRNTNKSYNINSSDVEKENVRLTALNVKESPSQVTKL